MGANSTGSTLTYGTDIASAGSVSNLNDGNTTDPVNTFGQANPSNGFVGIGFSTPVSLSLQVNSINYYGAFYFDGGWFGKNGYQANGTAGGGGNNGNESFASGSLIPPVLQVSYDYTPATAAASTWVTVSSTNNYLAETSNLMTPAPFGFPTITPAVTFTLGTPVVGITGIRLIGEDGGTPSGGGGFLGATEFQVEASAVPEPGTYAMMGIGLVLVGFCSRRLAARA